MVNERLKSAVAKKDIEMVRNELLGILSATPSMDDGVFRQALSYAEKNLGEDLFEEYDGVFHCVSDKKQWDSRYVAKIYFALRKNFSKEIVEHCIEVSPKVFQSKKAVNSSNGNIKGVKKVPQKKTGKVEMFIMLAVIIVIILIIAIILL